MKGAQGGEHAHLEHLESSVLRGAARRQRAFPAKCDAGRRADQGWPEQSQFIFTPEEQIEYASNILTIETGDVFSCGTCGGVGQGTNTFLAPGDVMETEIENLGKMRNRFVAGVA